jgi:hypothetical protein
MATTNIPLSPAANKNAPPVGMGMTLSAPLPIELDFPGSPKRFYEYGPVRFKFILDGKYEFFSAAVKGDRADAGMELKTDPSKKSASLRAGLKGKLTPNVDGQAIVKISADSVKNLGLAFGDPKKFIYGLVRYLDVVVGHNFKIDSQYLKTLGVGFALDADLCFGSMLIPLRYPLAWEQDNLSVKGQIVADLVVKVGPSMAMWKALADKFGALRVAAWARLLVRKANVDLPKIAATAIAGAEEIAMPTLLETISTFVGAFSLALPISFALRDFCMYITNAARAAGIADGQMMVFTDAYMMTVYGLQPFPGGDDAISQVKARGHQKAVEDMNSRGLVPLQIYLEQQFNGGRRIAGGDGSGANRIQVTVMAERMWLALRNR